MRHYNDLIVVLAPARLSAAHTARRSPRRIHVATKPTPPNLFKEADTMVACCRRTGLRALGIAGVVVLALGMPVAVVAEKPAQIPAGAAVPVAADHADKMREGLVLFRE